MVQVITKLYSYIVIEQLFVFLDLDGLFKDYLRIIRITITYILHIPFK